VIEETDVSLRVSFLIPKSHAYITATHHHREQSLMKIYDIPLRRLILKLRRTVRKRLDKRDRIGQRGRHSTPLYIRITAIAYIVLTDIVPHKDRAKPKRMPRTEKTLRPKMVSLQDSTQQVAKKPRTNSPRTHQIHI